MKWLVMAEKPSVAREYADYLGCRDKKDGYIEGPNYVVSWALGHLIVLKEPDEYKEEWKNWTLEQLPMIPDTFKIKVAEKTRKQFNIIKELINRPDIAGIINGGDSGREGELIQRYIYIMAKNKKPVKRLWVSSTTRAAIDEGFHHLLDSSQFDSLFQSALARAQTDWLYGLNYTRAVTVKWGNGKDVLSIGRCQTPILRLIVDRDKLIENFVPEKYYELQADFGDYIGKYQPKETIKDRKVIEKIENQVKNHTGQVVNVINEKKTVLPPQLYNLTALSKKMNDKYGFTAQKTLDVLQKLYEEYHIATYPRASARVIDHTMLNVVKNNIDKLSFGEFAKFIPELNIVASKRFVDESKIEDHHAIIPDFKNDNIEETYKKLNSDEKKLFDELIKSILAAFSPNYEYNSTTITTNVSGYDFVSKAKEVVNLGWKQLYTEEKDNTDEDIIKGNIKKGDTKEVKKTLILDKQTKPKPRYNESTLLGEMEKNNIGTEATRAGIIETLKKRKYITVNKKSLISSDLGKQLIDIIPIENIKSVEMTGNLEIQLELIKDGKINKHDLLTNICTDIRNNIEKIKKIESGPLKYTEENFGKCPLCKDGYVIKTKFGYGCSNWKSGCKFSIGKILGKSLTGTQVKSLLSKGETGIINGFVSKKTGKEFSAKLKLENGSIQFVMPEQLTCPTCGEKMINTDKVCKCDKCGILIFKTISGKKITDAILSALLQGKKTVLIKGFKNKKGEEFDSRLQLKDGKVVFCK